MKILFIVHDAVRGGAQLLALQYLSYFVKQSNTKLLIVLQQGGELENDFASISTTIKWPVSHKIPYKGIIGKLYKKFSGEARRSSKFYKTILDFKPTVVYINSVAALKRTSQLGNLLHCPFICHVHELNMSIRYYCGEERFSQATSYISHYIVVSNAVKDNLINRYNINAQKISRIYGCISPKEIEYFQRSNTFDVRKELGIPADALIVGSSGTFEWRKAPDIFLQVAATLRSEVKAYPIYFVWVGGDITSEEYKRLQYDIEKSNVGSYIKFTGAVSNPWKYFMSFDIFMLTSREDPFPLVCLEASAFGKPLLCFEGAGGMPEFVESDAGFVIPYLDVNQMAHAIQVLADDKSLRNKLGNRALSKVVEKLEMETIMAQVWELINKAQYSNNGKT